MNSNLSMISVSRIGDWDNQQPNTHINDGITVSSTDPNYKLGNCYIYPDKWRHWRQDPFVWPDYPNAWSNITLSAQSPWRVTTTGSLMTLSLDLAGVKKEDVSADISSIGLLKIHSKRFDTNHKTTNEYVIDESYDLNSIKVSFECCVLTVSVSKKKQNKPKNLKINLK